MIERVEEDDVCVVTMDRPERRNALTREGLDRLEAAVTDTDASVVYLRGAGDAFCAGADLDLVEGLDADAAEAFARRGQRVARAIETTESVVVGGIDGAARGGGVELALACDVRVATPDATFAESGVTLGLFGAWGGTARLPAVVGLGNAMDLALSGRIVGAEDALRTGLGLTNRRDPSLGGRRDRRQSGASARSHQRTSPGYPVDRRARIVGSDRVRGTDRRA